MPRVSAEKTRIRPGSSRLSPDSDRQGVIKFRQLADHGQTASSFNHNQAAFSRFFHPWTLRVNNNLLLSKRISATGTGIAAAKLPTRQFNNHPENENAKTRLLESRLAGCHWPCAQRHCTGKVSPPQPREQQLRHEF
jgi:hypothetical protein